MRIVLVNWAKIRDGAARGGGINGYCQALALELVGLGHEAVSLCGGTTFEKAAGSADPGPCVIRRLEDWRGIRVHEVINSPVLAPALAQFREPLAEVSAPELEERVAGLMAELQPDSVHIHSLEGFSAGCIGAIRRSAPRARVVFSLHNYHPICPQVYLMQGHRRPCFSFDSGHACAGCIPTVDPASERRRLASGSDVPAEFEWKRDAPMAAPGGWRTVVPAFLRRATQPPASPVSAATLAPPLVWSEANMTRPAWRPLENAPVADPPSARPPSDFARRRAAMVDALNACDVVLAVSDFVRAKFEAMGVRRDRLRTTHIGTRMTGIAARAAHRPTSRIDDARPIRLAFMGYHNWYKGLPMLADSLELLTPEVLRRFHLTVLALGGEEMEEQLRRIEPHLAGLTLRFGYTQNELPALLDGTDLGLVTSVWWDNGPQTVLEFLACGIPVLGAALGGIPDFIRDGVNGLLFRGNDRWDLARRLNGISRNPAEIGRLRAGVRPPKNISDHAAELAEMYSGRVS